MATEYIDPMAQLFDPDLMSQYRALLEPPPEAKRQAGMDALLALGLGLLGNRSPYFGVALGNAGMGAMGAHRYALDTARQNRMGEIQGAMGLRKLSKDINQEQARDKAFEDWLATQPVEKRAAARAAYLGAPDAWAKFMAEQQFPKMEPYTLGAGQQRRGPNNEILAELPAEPKQSELGRLWAEFHSYPVGSPERQSIMRKINKEETHAPAVQVQNFPTPIAAIAPGKTEPTLTYFGNKGDVIPTPYKPAPPAGGDKLTETEAKGSVFFKEMQDSEKLISGLVTKGLNPAAPKNQIAMRMAGSDWTNWMTPSEIQQYWASAERWAESFLRIKTGQAATEGEVRRNARMFFPQPGDKPEDVAFKEQMRRQAVESVRVVAGRGAAKVTEPQRSITVDW